MTRAAWRPLHCYLQLPSEQPIRQRTHYQIPTKQRSYRDRDCVVCGSQDAKVQGKDEGAEQDNDWCHCDGSTTDMVSIPDSTNTTCKSINLHIHSSRRGVGCICILKQYISTHIRLRILISLTAT